MVREPLEEELGVKLGEFLWAKRIMRRGFGSRISVSVSVEGGEQLPYCQCG